MMEPTPTISAMGLHALVYCERLFFLEEVERIRVADEHMFAGRTLHEALQEAGDFVTFTHESDHLGLRGKLDALRQRDGALIPYEHKRGHSHSGAAWDSDRIQLGAYALLLEEATDRTIPEGRIRYHGDKQLIRVPIDADLREAVQRSVQRAQELLSSVERPPVTVEETRCNRCSLAPVCLPEEGRRILRERKTLRLFPRDDERKTLHVTEHGTRIGRRGHELQIKPRDGEVVKVPVRTVRSVACHGYISVSAQALALCADHGIAVSWFSPSGHYRGSFHRDDDATQRRIRQYEALRQPGLALSLARKLVQARVEGQLRFLLRGTRGRDEARQQIEGPIRELRETLAVLGSIESPGSLLGHEGRGAAAYFRSLPALIRSDPALVPVGRSRRPPEDPFNALLSFGYSLLLREVHQAIRVVGLEAGFGFYHQPRSSAPPLALDLMELFRVQCVDMAVVGAVNRRQFHPERDFQRAGRSVWLSRDGRKKAIGLFEARLRDSWRHPVLEYSLSYRRHIELEVRLLEKEWSGEPGLFARARPR